MYVREASRLHDHEPPLTALLLVTPQMPGFSMATDQQSSLLGLPPEIRNNIFALVVVRSRPLGPLWNGAMIKEPALVATCRQIRSEALSLFYGDNTLQYVTSHHAFTAFERAPADKLAMLRSVRAFSVDHGCKDWLRWIRLRVRELLESARGHIRLDAILFPLDVDGEEIWVPANKTYDYVEVEDSGIVYFTRKDLE